jgi:hypothetical protein
MNYKISTYTGFQPLKEVWLGGVYPTEFYNHYDNKTQDIFGKITELTNKDLNQIEKKLIELGVTVRRPKFTQFENYLDEDKNLIKPPITPRDWAITLGDILYILPQYYSGIEPYQHVIDQYKNNKQKVVILDRSTPDPMCYIPPPSTVRVGKDLYIDYSLDDQFAVEMAEQALKKLSEHYRVHVTNTGDHSDGVFCPVANGHIFSTFYKTVYENTFPNWEVFFLTDTTKNRKTNGQNKNWWLPGMNYPHINDKLLSVANCWLGDSRETVFEVNMLVIDEKNVICIAEDDAACQKLESLGITPHVVDFKTRGFWDGGIHCLTLDIHRNGSCLDYWPDRGPNGIYRY